MYQFRFSTYQKLRKKPVIYIKIVINSSYLDLPLHNVVQSYQVSFKYSPWAISDLTYALMVCSSKLLGIS